MPADAYALPENVPSLDAAEDAVRDGLPAERERLAAARANDDFYQFRNCKHLEQRPDETEEEFDERPKRYSRITRTVVRKLAEPLYNPGPTRVVQSDASLSAWLEEAYEAASLNTRMQSADRAATLNHVAALQIEPTGDPRRPLRYWLWKGHEFAVFTRDGDPINPWAVCTIEQIPAGPESPGKLRTRYRLWSAFERRTYLTKPWGQRDTAGGRVAELVERLGPDEYPFPGVLPFVFVRNEPAETDFWDGGIGDALREANMEADRRLSNLAQHVEEFLNPFGWARGVPANASLARKVGRFTHLPTDPMARQGDNNIPPEVGYLQGQLGVEAAWYDLKAFLDSTLEDLEVPLTVVRSDASTDLSGVAIEKKTVPLLHRTRARQPQFSETESELAAKSLAVAAAWYGAAGWNLAAKAAAAAREPKLLCVWPEPRVIDSTSREGLDTLRAEMELGMTDGFEVMARLRGTTIEKAMVMARDTAQRQRLWAQLMGLDQADGQQGGQEDGQGGKQPPPDAEDEPTNDPED
jgi:hypothetical protein